MIIITYFRRDEVYVWCSCMLDQCMYLCLDQVCLWWTVLWTIAWDDDNLLTIRILTRTKAATVHCSWETLPWLVVVAILSFSLQHHTTTSLTPSSLTKRKVGILDFRTWKKRLYIFSFFHFFIFCFFVHAACTHSLTAWITINCTLLVYNVCTNP